MKYMSWPFTLLAVVLALGCRDDASEITAPIHPSLNVTQSGPFYYYQGSRVFLEEKPGQFVVQTNEQDGARVAREAASASGISIGTVTALPQARDHWLVTLPSQAQAGQAIASFRRDSRIRFAASAYRTAAGHDDVLLVNRVVVRFKNSVPSVQIDSLAAALGLELERPPRPDSGFFAYRFTYPKASPGKEPLDIAAALSENPLVAWADPDHISNRTRSLVPPDPYYSSQFHLNNSITRGGIRVDINAEVAWNRTLGGGVPSAGGTRVAVIDDGVNAGHEDLSAAVDPGYDVVTYNNAPGCSDCAASPYGDDSHGTMVAGVIGARHGANGVAGIAPETYIIPIRIFRGASVATNAAIADGICYAAFGANADVLSNSWGGGAPSNAITDAINSANTYGRGGKGAMVVFAAGNTSSRGAAHIGPVQYPATLASVIAVGAINRFGELTNYTPEGPELDIVAPSGHVTGGCSGEIVTTDLMGSPGCNDGPGGNINYTQTFSGTSAAAPQVSGVGILVYSVWPHLTSTQAKDWILSKADRWGPANQFGRGKLNAGRAVPSDPPVIPVSISGPTQIQPGATCTWDASVSGTPPYTYTWTNDGTWVSSGSSYTGSKGPGTTNSFFTLRLTVDDAAGAQGYSEVTVYESSGAQACFI